MPSVNLGRVGFVNKGDYVGGTTVHKVNDIRKWNNSVYVCIQAHSTEHLPSDVLYWQVWVDTSNYYVKSEVDTLLLTKVGIPIASFATTSIGGSNAGDILHITGTTSITSFGASVTGTVRTVIFDDVLTIVHNATSMILPGNTDMTTIAGSSAEFICENGALGYWRCTNVTHQSISMAELSYISTLTSNAQDQLNIKASIEPTSGAVYLGKGTTLQRPTLLSTARAMWYNTDLNKFEGWNGTQWVGVGGGATGGGADTVFVETSYAVTQNYTLTAGKSAITVGDSQGNVSIADGVSVTVPDGSIWVVQGV